MTATAVRSVSLPRPRHPADAAVAGLATPARSRAAAYQRVLHQLVRRELRTLADLAGWAPDGECARTDALRCHAALVSRVLLHHHAVEREALWPALLRAVPTDDRAAAGAAVAAWTVSCSRIDARLRDLDTTARQWSVSGSAPARDAFARACRTLADDVDAQTTAEEEALLPLLDRHLGRRRVDGDRPHGPLRALRAPAAAGARPRSGGRLRRRSRPAAARRAARHPAGLAALRRGPLPRLRRPAARRPAGGLTRQYRDVPHPLQRFRVADTSCVQLSQTQVVRSFVAVLMAASSTRIHPER
ncbi:hemerythrin domain-containing protein [Blastococcus saxobsidens]|uniref:Hemerythrin domain-containing protein n=1 Tax=Blastococcus saxobsidens TaxID=138336 RepID=A0A6L9W6W9_9ACTN|nr:hemerythrin domain-containing protein [Blastococcus saxobsidens]NEK87823.1 hemerythrin domain-containing protein [Blastococcus saxobsidens]